MQAGLESLVLQAVVGKGLLRGGDAGGPVLGQDPADGEAVLEDDEVVGGREVIQVGFPPVPRPSGVGHPQVPVVMGVVVPGVAVADQAPEDPGGEHPVQPGVPAVGHGIGHLGDGVAGAVARVPGLEVLGQPGLPDGLAGAVVQEEDP